MSELKNKTKEELNQLVKDLISGKVFTDRHLNSPSDMTSVFMTLSFGGLTKEFIDEIGMIYEYLEKAGPLSVNDNPSFFSCTFLNKEDAKYIWDKYFEIQESVEKQLEGEE